MDVVPVVLEALSKRRMQDVGNPRAFPQITHRGTMEVRLFGESCATADAGVRGSGCPPWKRAALIVRTPIDRYGPWQWAARFYGSSRPLYSVGAARFDSVPERMSRPQLTATIVENTECLGMLCEYYSWHTNEWVPVVRLTPEATTKTLLTKHGEIRNVSELIVLDPSVDELATVSEQLDRLTIGWRFETSGAQTDEWTELIELDEELTEDELRHQYDPLRNLTPLGSAMAVARAVYDEEQTSPEQPEAAGGEQDAR